MTGTPTSLEALLQESDWLRRVARALVRDEATADDLAQDVLDAASSRPPALEGRRLRGWLATVARRRATRDRARALARLRAERARSRAESFDPSSERDDALDRVVLHRNLVRVVAELGASERQAIVDRYLTGLSYAEIAARSGVSEGVVRQRTSRAVRRLRERLSDDDPRWAEWLPVLALATPVRRPPATPDASALASPALAPSRYAAGGLLTMKLAVLIGALAIALLALVAVSFTLGSDLRSPPTELARVGNGRAELSRDSMSNGAHAPLAATSRLAMRAPVEGIFEGARIAIVDPSGAPIDGLRAACILDDRSVRSLNFDADGTAPRPDERCVIVATAPGFVGREFALQAPEPGQPWARQVLDRTLTVEVELAFHDSDGGGSVIAGEIEGLCDAVRATAGRDAFPATFADRAMTERVGRFVDLDARVTVDRSRSGLRLSVPFETPRLQLAFPDHLVVTSVDGADVPTGSPHNLVRVDPSHRRLVIGLREVPSIALRALWEGDASPFCGSVSIARAGDYWKPGYPTRTDDRGGFRAAIVIDGDLDARARCFRFSFSDRLTDARFETEMNLGELASLGSPATILVPRPRVVHLHVVSESSSSFVAARAEVLTGGQVVETDERGRCAVSWPPGETILVSVLGYAPRILPEPSDRIDHGPHSPLRVVVHPSPTLEVLLPRTEGLLLRVDTASGVGLVPVDARTQLEPDAWRLCSRRTSAVGAMGRMSFVGDSENLAWVEYQPDEDGRINESCLRTDVPLRLSVVDRLGATLAVTEVQLDESRTVDLRDAVAETRAITVHIVDHGGVPVRIGEVRIAGTGDGARKSPKIGFHSGLVRVAGIAPGDYTVTAWALGQEASGGVSETVSVTDDDAAIRLTVVP